jgi:hypothetical protein
VSKAVDLTGQRFGNLIAQEKTAERGHSGGILWKCICDCGKLCSKLAGDLRSGHVKSCGCLNVEGKRLKPYEALYNNFRYVESRRIFRSKLANGKVLFSCSIRKAR